MVGLVRVLRQIALSDVFLDKVAIAAGVDPTDDVPADLRDACVGAALGGFSGVVKSAARRRAYRRCRSLLLFWPRLARCPSRLHPAHRSRMTRGVCFSGAASAEVHLILINSFASTSQASPRCSPPVESMQTGTILTRSPLYFSSKAWPISL